MQSEQASLAEYARTQQDILFHSTRIEFDFRITPHTEVHYPGCEMIFFAVVEVKNRSTDIWVLCLFNPEGDEQDRLWRLTRESGDYEVTTRSTLSELLSCREAKMALGNC